MKTKKYIRTTLIVLIWLALWQVLAVAVNNSILLSGPIDTVKALITLGSDPAFYISVGKTAGKILLGFLIGMLLGSVLSVLSYRFSLVKDFLSPFVSVIKSIPVVSFIIIALIWAGSSNVTIIVSSIISFPIFYKNILEGLFATDPKMIELAKVYQMKTSKKIRYIYLPSLSPHIKSAVSLAIGMAFRGGITAEVVGQPIRSIGNGLYRAKINLATSEMLAWTLVAVLSAFLIEKLISFIVKKVLK
ncbi:ABC transporter permease [Butyrivibrio sp. AE2032]|uniref:ABC transporter permease n=1 Tax=Butyrivibrio sp. AE2032 TaxID=1458463 RepID=UPI000559634C|nr:ABC transporter permease subunit [Butyrivibrio sp. AE2032]